MALRLVQAGNGDPRPLVLGFSLGSDQDMYLPVALGDRACIVFDDGLAGPALPELLEFAYREANLRHVSDLALVGYSGGCARIRSLRLAGANASAYVLMNGPLASWPPHEWEISWLRDLANQARLGRVLLVASHTQQTYMEELSPEHALASPWRVWQMATGWPLDKAGPVESPGVTRQGQLWVYSYASKVMDAAEIAAHYAQVPALCARHLGPWLDRPQPAPAPPQPPETAAKSDDGSLPLALLGVAAVMAMGAGKD